jgi:Ca2+-dependent lipid-binding protein
MSKNVTNDSIKTKVTIIPWFVGLYSILIMESCSNCLSQNMHQLGLKAVKLVINNHMKHSLTSVKMLVMITTILAVSKSSKRNISNSLQVELIQHTMHFLIILKIISFFFPCSILNHLTLIFIIRILQFIYCQ